MTFARNHLDASPTARYRARVTRSIVFLSDLVRRMDGDVSLDFMAVSSYAKGTTTSGEVRLLKDLDTTLDGRHVVIVEDIVDTGLTLTYLQDILRARGPRTLRTACLLSKPSRRQVDVKVEYIGFEIPELYRSGWTVAVLTIVLTVLIWVAATHGGAA